jgi:DNA-binding transcriptional ArsR family regulator
LSKRAKPRTNLQRRLSKSVASGIRIDILRILNERVASPKELAAILGEGLSHVSYHIANLRDNGSLVLVKTEQRRGAVEHYYRATSWPFVSDEDARELPQTTREEISATVLQAIFSEALGALQSGDLDARVERHVSWLPMDLSEAGVGEVLALLEETLEKGQEIAARDAERREETGEDGGGFIFSILGFDRSEAPGSK